jgi:hypothetical protein
MVDAPNAKLQLDEVQRWLTDRLTWMYILTREVRGAPHAIVLSKMSLIIWVPKHLPLPE